MLFVTAECPAWSVACFDGDGCVSAASLCDGRVQCRDRSDELLCAAKKGIHHTEMTTCITTGQSDNHRTLYYFLYLNFFCPRNSKMCHFLQLNVHSVCQGYILRTDPLLFNSNGLKRRGAVCNPMANEDVFDRKKGGGGC